MADGLNDARALRMAEIFNDYRTLLVHISQQDIPVPAEDYYEPGYAVIRESLAAAQALMSSNYNPVPPTGRNDLEMEKAEFRRVILDISSRRFQAHKIYLRAAAGRRWSINRADALQRPQQTHASRLKLVDDTFRQELGQVTDEYVVADLRAADIRAGHWLDEDPSLQEMRNWIREHP
ncbi:hypothetical protein BDV27DRAFT_138028 [Aspergillus caelatus]|uniref:Uncharacterized protein n=2 Tax=Aspergillus subgen. Circumdati TaxID=2720871 RepID=A0A5N6ZKU5_9EURO|nr:uncharacterized protein BDV27DRAFT_138028 [Aspergillus caelatus]KAE8358241.1 hypothetical protein BDV27DRAFT_138028 [Aspergillus caelatus]KAE8421882.1 hypothetical protein BDV36DRAFT_247030 [Aspergillus pseudocaelatus]